MKKKYMLGHYRIRLERCQYDFEWEKINLPTSVIKR